MDIGLAAQAFGAAFGVSVINNFGLGHVGRGAIGGLAAHDAIHRIRNLSQTNEHSNMLYDGFRIVGDGYALFESSNYFLEYTPKLFDKTREVKKSFMSFTHGFNSNWVPNCYDRDPEKYTGFTAKDLDKFWFKHPKTRGFAFTTSNTYLIIPSEILSQRLKRKKSIEKIDFMLSYTEKHELAHLSHKKMLYKILGKNGVLSSSKDYLTLSGKVFSEFFAEFRSGRTSSNVPWIAIYSKIYLTVHGLSWLAIAALTTTPLLYDFLKKFKDK